MTHDMDEAIERSEQYQRLLDNPNLKAAFEQLREDAIEAWTKTGANEVAAREDAWQMLRAVERLERTLRARADEAKGTLHNARTALKKMGKLS